MRTATAGLFAHGRSLRACLSRDLQPLPFNNAPDDVKDGTTNIYAVVDDTMVPHPTWQECRIDNNIGTNTGRCLVPN